MRIFEYLSTLSCIYISNTGSSFFAKEWHDPIVKGFDGLFETMIGGEGDVDSVKGTVHVLSLKETMYDLSSY